MKYFSRKHINLIFCIWLTLGIAYTSYSADYSAEIKSIVPADKNGYVNYGPCFINDSLDLQFYLKNTGDNPILMSPLRPTFYLGLSPNDETKNQFNLYRRNGIMPILPKVFDSGESDTLEINFLAGDTIISNTGWHEALLGLAFVKPDDPDGMTISKIDSFYLRVKKTPYFVAGYDDEIYFDSVYINPNIKIEKNWRVKNVWTENQLLLNFEKKIISYPNTKDEFDIAELTNNYEILPYNTISFPISYSPKDRGKDSVFLKLNYRPLPLQFPDSIDYAWTSISGVGVEQDVRINNSNFNWNKDTIDLGDISLENAIAIEFEIINKSNFPLGVIGQTITNAYNNSVYDNFTITKPFDGFKKHISIDETSQISITFIPDEPGSVLARVQLESDILNRKFLGVQPDKRFINFYIKANIKAPILLSSANNIDFGNIIINNSICQSDIDTNLVIYNTGNSDLLISKILFEPNYPDGNFYSNDFQLLIKPKESGQININFRGNSGEFREYSANLLLISNQKIPNDTIKIPLKAQSVPPVTAYLSMPQDIKSKPGTIIEVPIVLSSNNGSPSRLAKTFTTSLVYNRLLLEYIGIETINTAMEGTFNFGDFIENPNNNELFLNLVTPQSNYFLDNDTLFFLKFRTFLGNSPATEISFINPKFGDENCDDIFTLINRNGIYSTDSVCGLDYKAIPDIQNGFNFSVFYSNIKSPDLIEFDVPYQTDVIISIYDILGNKIKDIFENNLPIGSYRMNYNFEELPSAQYFAMFKTPAYLIVKPFTVIR